MNPDTQKWSPREEDSPLERNLKEYFYFAESDIQNLTPEILSNPHFLKQQLKDIGNNLSLVLQLIKKNPELSDYQHETTSLVNRAIAAFNSSAHSFTQLNTETPEEKYLSLVQSTQLVEGFRSLAEKEGIHAAPPLYQQIFQQLVHSVYQTIEEYLQKPNLYHQEIQNLVGLAKRVEQEQKGITTEPHRLEQYLQKLKEDTTPPSLSEIVGTEELYDPRKEGKDQERLSSLLEELESLYAEREELKTQHLETLSELGTTHQAEIDELQSALKLLENRLTEKEERYQQLDQDYSSLESTHSTSEEEYQKDLEKQRIKSKEYLETIETLKEQLRAIRDPENIAFIIIRKDPDGKTLDYSYSALYAHLDSGKTAPAPEQDIKVFCSTEEKPYSLSSYPNRHQISANTFILFEDDKYLVCVLTVNEKKKK